MPLNKLDADECAALYDSLCDSVDCGLMYRAESYAQLAEASGIDQQHLAKARIGKATLTAGEFIAVLAAVFPNEVARFAAGLATASKENRPNTPEVRSQLSLARRRNLK